LENIGLHNGCLLLKIPISISIYRTFDSPVYNGKQRWTSVTDVAELIPVVPGLVEQFKPRLKYLLIDENAYSDTELASLNNLVAAVFRFEQADSPATIESLISLLIDWLDDRPDLRRMFSCGYARH